MKAVLIFDNVNNLLFSKWDDEFILRMKSFSEQESDINVTDSHSVSQLMSPIITSQRVMAAQFGNTYSSMQCKDGTNIVFDEWLDHVLMIVNDDDVDDMHRELLDTKTYVQHICGQNINLLQSSIYQDWLSVLINNRCKGDYVPGASGIIGETGASATALNSLKATAKDVKCSSYPHYHLMLFVGNKMLALYSSRGSEDLTPPDLIMLSTQCVAAQEHWAGVEKGDSQKDGSNTNHLPWLSQENSAIVNLCGGTNGIPCTPHSMHIDEVAPRITLLIVVDLELRETGIAAQMSSVLLCNLRSLLLQRNLDLLPSTLDSLEGAVKKTADAMRKNKLSSIVGNKLTTKMIELRKSCTTTTPLTPETTASALRSALESVLELLRPNIPSLNTRGPLRELREKMAPFVDFLRVKAMRFFGLGSAEDASCSITRHKYVEEFPGLIHFIYIDRTTGRYLAPDMTDCADLLTPKALRGMISRGLRLLREGYTAATWRGNAAHACALLWWEKGNTALKPVTLHPAAVRALPPPGDILGSFYKQLAELAFPNESSGVCTKELLCIHLGLLPAATALQQARRLAHTVLELAGDTHSAADLL